MRVYDARVFIYYKMKPDVNKIVCSQLIAAVPICIMRVYGRFCNNLGEALVMLGYIGVGKHSYIRF